MTTFVFRSIANLYLISKQKAIVQLRILRVILPFFIGFRHLDGMLISQGWGWLINSKKKHPLQTLSQTRFKVSKAWDRCLLLAGTLHPLPDTMRVIFDALLQHALGIDSPNPLFHPSHDVCCTSEIGRLRSVQ